MPLFATPYFSPNTLTPNIIADFATGPALQGGAAPFGLLPSSFFDPTVLAAIVAAPANTVAIILRYDAGPLGFSTKYNTTSVVGTTDTFDAYVVYNMSGQAVDGEINGVALA